MWLIYSSNTYVEIIEENEKIKIVIIIFLPAPFDQPSMSFEPIFSTDWPPNGSMLSQNVNSCPNNMTDLLW